MALSKKLAKTISDHINGLNVYGRFITKAKFGDPMLNKYFKWYNDEARALVALGIHVNTYKHKDGTEY